MGEATERSAVPTVIEFIGHDRKIMVAESSETVLQKLAAAADRPFSLEAVEGWTLYVNPESVACWYEPSEEIAPGRLDPR